MRLALDQSKRATAYLGLDLLSHGRIAANVGVTLGVAQHLPDLLLVHADQMLHVRLRPRRNKRRKYVESQASWGQTN